MLEIEKKKCFLSKRVYCDTECVLFTGNNCVVFEALVSTEKMQRDVSRLTQLFVSNVKLPGSNLRPPEAW